MMKTANYFVSITYPKGSNEVMSAILALIGKRWPFFGQSDDKKEVHLWCIPNNPVSKEDLLLQIQNIAGIYAVEVVTVSESLLQPKMLSLRSLFVSIGWDANGVSDDELSIFIDDKLHERFCYYIDLGLRPGRQIPAKICIRAVEEAPDLVRKRQNGTSTLQTGNQQPEFTAGDLEISREVYRTIIEPPIGPSIV